MVYLVTVKLNHVVGTVTDQNVKCDVFLKKCQVVISDPSRITAARNFPISRLCGDFKLKVFSLNRGQRALPSFRLFACKRGPQKALQKLMDEGEAGL